VRLPSAAPTWFFEPSLARKSSIEEEKFSRSACRVAMRRACHQLLDEPKVFDTPGLARPRDEPDCRTAIGFHRGQPSLRDPASFLGARSRFAEDELEAALERGLRQYVRLGAGFDGSAFRVTREL
jgi:O-methyltransferase involved in polyketide biosynthesis